MVGDGVGDGVNERDGVDIVMLDLADQLRGLLACVAEDEADREVDDSERLLFVCSCGRQSELRGSAEVLGGSVGAGEREGSWERIGVLKEFVCVIRSPATRERREGGVDVAALSAERIRGFRGGEVIVVVCEEALRVVQVIDVQPGADGVLDEQRAVDAVDAMLAHRLEELPVLLDRRGAIRRETELC